MRAEIRTGELLIEMKERGEREVKGGDRKSKSHAVTLIPKLADIGVNKMRSSRIPLPAGRHERMGGLGWGGFGRPFF
jgi:hypothetical protein